MRALASHPWSRRTRPPNPVGPNTRLLEAGTVIEGGLMHGPGAPNAGRIPREEFAPTHRPERIRRLADPPGCKFLPRTLRKNLLLRLPYVVSVCRSQPPRAAPQAPRPAKNAQRNAHTERGSGPGTRTLSPQDSSHTGACAPPAFPPPFSLFPFHTFPHSPFLLSTPNSFVLRNLG